jgi:large conductance mechanosensitive channel
MLEDDFLIVAFAIFLLVRWINKMRERPEAAVAEPTTKACPFCLFVIPIKAVRCLASLQGDAVRNAG